MTASRVSSEPQTAAQVQGPTARSDPEGREGVARRRGTLPPRAREPGHVAPHTTIRASDSGQQRSQRLQL